MSRQKRTTRFVQDLDRLYRLPNRLVVVLACVVFVTELAVMLFLDAFPWMDGQLRAIVDAVMLTLLLCPSLYVFVLRPLMTEQGKPLLGRFLERCARESAA